MENCTCGQGATLVQHSYYCSTPSAVAAALAGDRQEAGVGFAIKTHHRPPCVGYDY